MSKGVLLFAFNSPKYNYYEMAVATAKRINHFLGLPVTIVTDSESLPVTQTYQFDNVILAPADKSNSRDWGVWINKGRYRAYQFSPYDDTILLDTDYMVNSDKLLKLFDMPTDFCCHDTTSLANGSTPPSTNDILQANKGAGIPLQKVATPVSLISAPQTPIPFKATALKPLKLNINGGTN